MKKTLLLGAFGILFIVADIQPTECGLPQSSQKLQSPVLKRIDSRVRIPALKDAEKLPPALDMAQYISIAKRYLSENGYLLTPNYFDSFELMESFLADHMSHSPFLQAHKEGTDASLPEDVAIIDLSLPNLVKVAEMKLKEFETSKKRTIGKQDPSSLPAEINFDLRHLKWILEYFKPNIEQINTHIVTVNDHNDSGLSEEKIELLLKLTVGPGRVFRIDDLSPEETENFIKYRMRVMLRNATGFQRVMALLITSILNSVKETQFVENFDHVNIHVVCRDKYSRQLITDIDVETVPLITLDGDLFHEITHAYHDMVGYCTITDSSIRSFIDKYTALIGTDAPIMDSFRALIGTNVRIPTDLISFISNVSIINSRDLNLIDQFFPMLVPSRMNPILQSLEEKIDQYWGKDFSKTTVEECEKLVVLILEPIIRNAVIVGFGSFFFSNSDAESASFKVSREMLTSSNMAKCIYLYSNVLSRILLPALNEHGVVTIQTNIETFKEIKRPIPHPYFKTVSILPKYIETGNSVVFRIGEDSLWNTAEEKLTMQGNVVFNLLNSRQRYYVQDRQHEQIYLIRERSNSKSVPISEQFRFHQQKDYGKTQRLFELMVKATPSLKIDLPSVKNDFDISPSEERKYGVQAESAQGYIASHMDQTLFDTWASIIDKNYGKDIDEQTVIEGLSPEHEKKEFEEAKVKIEHLIAEGNDINVANNVGETPLMQSLGLEKLDIAHLLIDNGADVQTRDNAGNTPLHWAVRASSCNIDIITHLLSKGADVSAKDDSGNSVLHTAVDYAQNNLTAVQFLLSQKIDVNAKNNAGKTPLHIAAEHNNVDAINLLIKAGAKLNEQDKNGYTPLHCASSNHSVEAIQILLAASASVNIRTNEGWLPLHVVCKHFYNSKHLDCAELLTMAVTNIDDIDFVGKTALHYAIMSGNIDLPLILLKKQAKPDIRDYNGDTPLHLAVGELKSDMVELLISHGANVNIQNKNGNTPLHEAIALCDKRSLELLWPKSDLTIKNNKNQTPVDIALEIKDTNILSFILTQAKKVFPSQ